MSSPPASARHPRRSSGEPRRGGTVSGLLRWGGPVIYAAALTLYTRRYGFPVARDRLMLWVLLALLVCSLTDLRRWLRSVLLEWLPFALILFTYDLLRGYADGLLVGAHTVPQIRAERWLFSGTVPTVWLQRHLWHGADDLRIWDYATWAVYLTHFLATLTAAGLLWLFAPHRFRRYMTMVSVLAAMGFTTYVLFPAVPPWMASTHGYLRPTSRIVGHVWTHVPLTHFNALFEKGTHYANNVAAMPSLHAAYALLITLFFWRTTRWGWRIPLALYPVAMAFSLVYSAEHYFVDVLAGWLYAAAGFWAVNRVADRLASRRSGATATSARAGASRPRRARSASALARLTLPVAAALALAGTLAGAGVLAARATLPRPTEGELLAVKVVRQLHHVSEQRAEGHLNGRRFVAHGRRVSSRQTELTFGRHRLVAVGTRVYARGPSPAAERQLAVPRADLSGAASLLAAEIASRLLRSRPVLVGHAARQGERAYVFRLSDRPRVEALVSERTLLPVAVDFRSRRASGHAAVRYTLLPPGRAATGT